jgi:hypothetical protein
MTQKTREGTMIESSLCAFLITKYMTTRVNQRSCSLASILVMHVWQFALFEWIISQWHHFFNRYTFIVLFRSLSFLFFNFVDKVDQRI